MQVKSRRQLRAAQMLCRHGPELNKGHCVAQLIVQYGSEMHNIFKSCFIVETSYLMQQCIFL